MTSEVFALASALIERVSVTPDDAGCQPMLDQRLEDAGMQVESLRFGEVDNTFATIGHGNPHLLLLGHTDVVPSGPASEWTSPPFSPEVRDGMLYGRGAADMKSSVAAFVLAAEKFARVAAGAVGRLSILLTSDEEGLAADGVRRVVPWLEARGLLPDHVLVGEPSSSERLGDVIRIGRRGSIQARLTIKGEQGHTAYARPEDNPVNRAAPLLAALTALKFDDGDNAFPPTRLQVSNVRAGTGADNVTPGRLEIMFNLRHNPNSTADELKKCVEALLVKHALPDCRLDWRISGAPFGPADGRLLAAVTAAVRDQLGLVTRPDTGGGTSDGRFFGPLGIETVELGPVNRTIHKVDESISIDDLERLPDLYLGIIERVLT
ncbi:MAG TPA: succinyl-diaminopimelate desuccinylase [Wenzhouxiangellaceae bacterium]|nr:succinyl-diaminopimelate desuccinylase [Wenzhouxiangellaceae bacterium]